MHRAVPCGRAHLGLVRKSARMQQASARPPEGCTGNLRRSWSERANYSTRGYPWVDLPRLLHGLCQLWTPVAVCNRYVCFAPKPCHTAVVRRLLQWHRHRGRRAESADDKIQVDVGRGTHISELFFPILYHFLCRRDSPGAKPCSYSRDLFHQPRFLPWINNADFEIQSTPTNVFAAMRSFHWWKVHPTMPRPGLYKACVIRSAQPTRPRSVVDPMAATAPRRSTASMALIVHRQQRRRGFLTCTATLMLTTGPSRFDSTLSSVGEAPPPPPLGRTVISRRALLLLSTCFTSSRIRWKTFRQTSHLRLIRRGLL